MFLLYAPAFPAPTKVKVFEPLMATANSPESEVKRSE